MGFSFVAFGFYTIYCHSPVVISHSTQNAAGISQAFTTVCVIWHFLALIPPLSVMQRVKSEEWWRRLLNGTSFNRANSVSSNVGGIFGHAIEIVTARSSQCFKLAWIAILITYILADIAPAVIHVEIGRDAIPAAFPVPALPSDSIYNDYSNPFIITGDRVHTSMDVAPLYYKAIVFAETFIKAAPPAPNALVPRPNISPPHGYRYLTDVYVDYLQHHWKRALITCLCRCRVLMDYKCSWHAPVLAEPGSMTGDIDTQTLPITAGGVRGLGYAPLADNGVFSADAVAQQSLIPRFIDAYPMIGYTDPATGKPSFGGNVAFVVTATKPNYFKFDLSSVPTSTPSAGWRAASAAFRSNLTTSSEPVESISVAVCIPKYSIEPWIVELVNGSTTLVQQQSHGIGNLDTTQLNIAIQDCFYRLHMTPPIAVEYGLSIAQLVMLFDSCFNNSTSSCIPKPPDYLSAFMNLAISSSIQAYLDSFPFGSFTPPQSKLLIPALVLSAEPSFLYATTVLYMLLSGILIYSFRRPAAIPITIGNILRLIREVPESHALNIISGYAVAAKIEHISTFENSADDSTTEAQINKSIGGYHAMVRQDPANQHSVLEVDLLQSTATQNVLVKFYESMSTSNSRMAWIFTPALGAVLVGVGIATLRHPIVVSQSPHDAETVFFPALFTWGLGIWRSLSLLAIGGLIRQANSDVSTFKVHFKSLQLTGLLPLSGMESSAQMPRAAWIEQRAARDVQ
jgi:hypothetical protein